MGFVLWLFISNLIQILLMPLIMVGAKHSRRQHADARAEKRSRHQYQGGKSEIEVILHHLEYQNQMPLALMKKMDVTLDKVLSD